MVEIDTLIIGAGAVGGVIGGLLHASGHATGLLVRDVGGAAAPVPATLRVGFASHRAPVIATGVPMGARLADFAPRRVLIAVKYPALDAVAAALRELPPEVPIVSCLNGVRSTDILRQSLPGRQIAHLTVLFNSKVEVPLSSYRLTTRPMLTLEQRDAPFRAGLRRAGFMVTQGDASAAWGKLLFNLNNAICTLTDSGFLDLMRDRHLRRAFVHTLDEAVATLAAAGIPFRMPLPVPYRAYRMMGLYLGPLPAYVARLGNSLSAVARPSMAADIAAGRPTEVEQINGEISALGRAVGRPTPVNDALVRLIHTLEAQDPPQFLSPAALRAALEAAVRAGAGSGS
ncbi:MAG TPA: ketopantoate reductase C-terminal domain-containing protein [Candidatus Acidoferrales bacterium]|nr:ketopantoate reductase C-terminal domain-containing protein [Candidatus Acidoferrales bacterium]